MFKLFMNIQKRYGEVFETILSVAWNNISARKNNLELR